MRFSDPDFKEDLRIRFGIILALALFPLLIFSVWHSVQDFQRERDVQTLSLLKSTRSVTSDITSTLELAKAVLRTTVSLDDGVCDVDLAQMTTEFSQLLQISIFDAEGQLLCSASPRSLEYQGDVARLSTIDPFHIYVHEPSVSDESPADALAVSMGVFNGSDLASIYSVITDTQSIRSLRDAALLREGTHIAVVDDQGTILVRNSDREDAIQQEWLRESRNLGEVVRKSARDSEGEKRDIYISPTSDEDVFIVTSREATTFFSYATLSPLSSMLVPLLGWLFAFVAIWLATEALLLKHLRRMHKTTVKFGQGNYDVRLGDFEDAPGRIQQLASDFDRMADRVSSREAKLQDSLEQKETLLREVHHRVKNNLQIIISLLNMQKRRWDDPQYIEAIDHTRNRISAIAYVHKALYESDDIRLVDMRTFLEQMISQLARGLGADQNDIRLNIHVDAQSRDPDQTISIGLYIVEAVTNAVKHGVPEGGEIDVSVLDTETDTIISIKDSGGGPLPEGSMKSMGQNLMRGFARQLSGTHHATMSGDGFTSVLTIPRRETESR